MGRALIVGSQGSLLYGVVVFQGLVNELAGPWLLLSPLGESLLDNRDVQRILLLQVQFLPLDLFPQRLLGLGWVLGLQIMLEVRRGDDVLGGSVFGLEIGIWLQFHSLLERLGMLILDGRLGISFEGKFLGFI